MATTSDERRKEPKESWSVCPHCGAHFRTWNCWFGSTLWVWGYNSMEPVMEFRFCPNCWKELKGSESDGTEWRNPPRIR